MWIPPSSIPAAKTQVCPERLRPQLELSNENYTVPERIGTKDGIIDKLGITHEETGGCGDGCETGVALEEKRRGVLKETMPSPFPECGKSRKPEVWEAHGNPEQHREDTKI